MPKTDPLATLRKSISEMTTEEIEERLRISRNSRSAPAPKKTKTKEKRPKEKKQAELNFDDITPEMAAALLAKLQNNE